MKNIVACFLLFLTVQVYCQTTKDSLTYNSKAFFAPIRQNGKKILTNKKFYNILLSCEREKETFKKFRRGNIAYFASSLAIGIGGFAILSMDESTKSYAYLPFIGVAIA